MSDIVEALKVFRDANNKLGYTTEAKWLDLAIKEILELREQLEYIRSCKEIR